jgi:hypothetical protein
LKIARLIACALLAVFSMTALHAADNSITIPQHRTLHATDPNLSLDTCADPRVICVSQGSLGEATVICGMTVGGPAGSSCGTIADATCLPGSAVELARALSPTPINRVTIKLLPGVYPECVAVSNLTGVNFIGMDKASIIRPDVLVFNSVNGGVFRIGTTGSDFTTTDIELSHFTIWSDAIVGTEAALQIGTEGGSSKTWTRVYGHDLTLIGTMHALATNGSTTGETVPVAAFWNIDGIAGGWVTRFFNAQTVTLRDSTILSMTNWSESSDTAGLSTIGPTAVNAGAGSTTTLRLQAADLKGDDFWDGRKFTVGGGGACGANGYQGWAINYVASTNLVTFPVAAAATLDDADCTYTIDPVKNAASTGAYDFLGPGCNGSSWCKDWTLLRGNTGNGFHGSGCMGLDIGVTPVQGASIVQIDNVSCRVEVNDFGAWGATTVNPASYVAGFIWHDRDRDLMRIANSDVLMNINFDMRDDTSTVPVIMGVGLAGDPTPEVPSVYTGNITINNNGDPDENVFGIVSSISPSASGTLQVPRAFVDINNTVAGYAGMTATLFQATNGTLIAGDITSPDVVTTIGTIKGWSERCFTFPDKIGVASAEVIPVSDGSVGLQLAYVGCRCYGLCGNAETLNIQDEVGNIILGVPLACVDNIDDMTWTDARGSPDALLPASKSPLFATGVLSDDVTDDLQVCLRYSTSRFAP